MAKAIQQIEKQVPNAGEDQAEAIANIIKALGENQNALLSMIGIIKELHEMGVLDAIHALLEQRTSVGEIAIQQLNQPAMHNTVKNGINMFKFIGSVDPVQLNSIFKGISQGFERSAEKIQSGETPSLWKLGTSLRDPEVKASLSTAMEFLYGMGQVFNNRQNNAH